MLFLFSRFVEKCLLSATELVAFKFITLFDISGAF